MKRASVRISAVVFKRIAQLSSSLQREARSAEIFVRCARTKNSSGYLVRALASSETSFPPPGRTFSSERIQSPACPPTRTIV